MTKGKNKKRTNKRQKAEKPVKLSTDSLKGWLANTRLVGLLLMVFAFLLYANTAFNEYAQDDAIVITDNMFTTDGVQGIPGILSKDTFYGFFKEEGKAALVAGGRYRPLTLVMFAAEYQLFGESPALSHLINALLFALSCGLLYLVLLQMLKGRGETLALVTAFLATLIFASHPIHTEAVANIKGRDEIMALMGSLGALYFAWRAYHKKSLIPVIWSALCFFGALLSKENAITFLAVIPLTFYFFTKAKSTRIILSSTMALLVTAGVFIGIRSAVLGFSFSEPSMELMNNPFIKIENNQYVPFTASEKLSTVVYTAGKYLQLLVVPYPLTHDYYPRQIDYTSWSDWRVLLSLLLHLGLLAYAFFGFRRKAILSYAILYYFITFSIVSNVLFPVGTHLAERLLYMPSVGYCLALGYLGYLLAVRRKKPPFTLQTFTPVLVGFGVVALLFAGMTISRNQVWKDNFTLFTTDIASSPNSAKLRNAVGGELTVQAVKLPEGNARRTEMLQEAVGHLQEAIKLHPNYKNAYLLLGNSFNHLKQYEQSISYYQKALELDPGYADAEQNLGITYTQAGRYYGEQQNDLNKSLTYLNKAISLRPNDYETLRLLGVANGIAGKPQIALDYFSKAVQQKPEDADANFNLAVAYYNMNDTIQGNRYRDKALQIDPQLLEKRQGNR